MEIRRPLAMIGVLMVLASAPSLAANHLVSALALFIASAMALLVLVRLRESDL